MIDAPRKPIDKDSLPILFTTGDVGFHLGCTERNVRHLTDRGLLVPIYRTGSGWILFDREAVLSFAVIFQRERNKRSARRWTPQEIADTIDALSPDVRGTT